jgi:dipeptidyl-peptidase-4
MLNPSPRLLLVLLLALVAQLPAYAQQKLLTMEDAFLDRSLQPENSRQLSWIPASQDEYSFLRTSGGQDELMRASIGGNPKTVVTLNELG